MYNTNWTQEVACHVKFLSGVKNLSTRTKFDYNIGSTHTNFGPRGMNLVSVQTSGFLTRASKELYGQTWMTTLRLAMII